MTLVARITFLVLVGATFGAFFVAQRLKSAAPVIHLGGVARFFSPNHDGRRDVNDFSVTLKASDDVTVDVVNLDGDPVRRLADAAPARAYRPLKLAWDGSTDAGGRAADGQYRVRVALRQEGRSVVVPQTMTLDTTPPRPVVCVGVPCSSRTTANVAGPEPGRVKVYVKPVSPTYRTGFTVVRTDDGPPRPVASFDRAAGFHRAIWDGLVAGRPAPPGIYLIEASVRDRAGNVGTTPAEVAPGAVPGRPGLTVRGIAAQPPLAPVPAGGRAAFFVDARGRGYRWRVRRVGESAVRKRGEGRPGQARLVLHAPGGSSGAYLLELRSGRWHTSVPFLVQGEQRSQILVVVPAITWLGADKVDDPPFDGVPNSLETGGPVRWPRVLRGAGDAGLPAGFADQVAPLLVFLDRRRVRYDLTTDLELALSRNPRRSDRDAVLLAGSERWVTRTLGRRLRRFVLDGGRLASFGTDSLRRGVTLRTANDGAQGRLLRPTQPSATDPFGARLGRIRTLSDQAATLSQFEGDTSYGLMTGVVELTGFSRLEESAPVTGDRAKLLAGVGQPLTDVETVAAEQSGRPAREPRPALTAVRLGKGTVIRVGLPEWTQRLTDPQVAQVTRNIVDILRGVTPKIRSER